MLSHGYCQTLCQTLLQRCGPMLLIRWCGEIDKLLDQLASKMSKGSLPKKSPKKITEPKEFNLTQPKPRPLPAAEVIPQQDKPKPVSIPVS